MASTMAAGEAQSGIFTRAALDVMHLPWVAVKLADL